MNGPLPAFLFMIQGVKFFDSELKIECKIVRIAASTIFPGMVVMPFPDWSRGWRA